MTKRWELTTCLTPGCEQASFMLSPSLHCMVVGSTCVSADPPLIKTLSGGVISSRCSAPCSSGFQSNSKLDRGCS